MVRRCIAAIALLGLASSPLFGAAPYAYKLVLTPPEGPSDPSVEARYTHQLMACLEADATTIAMADCHVEEFDRQDAALNAAWKRAFPRQSKANQAALRTAQRQWVVARDPFCRKQADSYSGGSIAPIIYVSCRTELTIRRTIWLEQLATAPR